MSNNEVTCYSNATDRRNNINKRDNKEAFNLIPDPDGFLG